MPSSFSLRRRDALATLAGLGCTGLALPTAHAALAPGQPIKVLIGIPAGSTQDILTRAIDQELRGTLGPLVLENRAGASGRIAVEAVKHAAPDGQTILLGTASMMTMFPSAFRRLSYDPVNDFQPILNAARFELALVVHESVPVGNLAEFVAWARAQGDKVSFASYGAGTPSHFLGEMLNRAAGLKMIHVPYKGSAPARQDLMGGQLQVFCDTVGGAIQMQPSGRVKVLATSGEKRSPLMPALPCFVEAGYKDVVATAWFAYFAPRKTPPAVLDPLRAAFSRALAAHSVRETLLANGMYPLADGPDALRKTMREDTARWAAIMKATHFHADE